MLLATTTSCLKAFNPNLKTSLGIDGSSEGLDTLLVQKHGTLT